MTTLLLLLACKTTTDAAPLDSAAPDDSAEPAVIPDYEPVDALRFELSDTLELGERELLYADVDLNGDGRSDVVLLDGEALVSAPVDAEGRFGEVSPLGVSVAALAQAMASGADDTPAYWTLSASDAGDLDGSGRDALLLELWVQWAEGGTLAHSCGTFAVDRQAQILLHVEPGSACVPAQLLADGDGDGALELLLHATTGWTLHWSGGEVEALTLDSGVMASVYRPHSHLVYLNDDAWPELVSFPDAGFGFAGGAVAWGSAEGFGALQPFGEFIHGYVTASERDAARPQEMMALDSQGELWWIGEGQSAVSQLTTAEEAGFGFGGVLGQLDGVAGLDVLLFSDGGPLAWVGDGAGAVEALPVTLEAERGELHGGDVNGDGLDDVVSLRWAEVWVVEIWRNASQD